MYNNALTNANAYSLQLHLGELTLVAKQCLEICVLALSEESRELLRLRYQLECLSRKMASQNPAVNKI